MRNSLLNGTGVNWSLFSPLEWHNGSGEGRKMAAKWGGVVVVIAAKRIWDKYFTPCLHPLSPCPSLDSRWLLVKFLRWWPSPYSRNSNVRHCWTEEISLLQKLVKTSFFTWIWVKSLRWKPGGGAGIIPNILRERKLVFAEKQCFVLKGHKVLE